MKPHNHLRLLTMVTIAWVLFWIGGLPDYYLQYSPGFMVIFDLIILPPIIYLVYRSVKPSRPGRAFANCMWWAFYISVPLFVYDLLYCGLYLGHGLRFLSVYWYITVYYILPWLIFPFMGKIMDRQRSFDTSGSSLYNGTNSRNRT